MNLFYTIRTRFDVNDSIKMYYSINMISKSKYDQYTIQFIKILKERENIKDELFLYLLSTMKNIVFYIVLM